MKKRGRKPVLVTIDLPMPPAPHEPSADCDDWLQKAVAAVKDADLQSVPGVVSVKVLAAITPEQRDIAQISRAVITVLIAENIIADDLSIVDAVARWDKTIPSGVVRVIAKRTIPPAQRIGPETRLRVVQVNQGRRSSTKTDASRQVTA